jgi:hypothetical protein
MTTRNEENDEQHEQQQQQLDLSQNTTPGLALDEAHDRDPYSYHPSWRPPTPPPQTSHQNENETSSWFQSFLSKHQRNINNSIDRHRYNEKYSKFPPGKAFQIPDIRSYKSEDSMVDTSLLLTNESLATALSNNDQDDHKRRSATNENEGKACS